MSGTRPHFISITAMRVAGWTTRMSAPLAIWRPPPKQTPWTAAMTGTGHLRQVIAACCARLALPCVRSTSFACGFEPPAAMLDRSSPAQKARPSPDRTATRKPFISRRAWPASSTASNCAPSSAFILSPRVKRTCATPLSARSIETRSWKFMPKSSLPAPTVRRLHVNHTFDQPCSARKRFTFRAACLMRCSFSTMAMRTKPSPSSP